MKMKVREKLLLVLTAGCLGFASIGGYAIEHESAKLLKLKAQLKKDQTEESAVRGRLMNMISDMVQVMKDYDVSAKSMEGVSGLGRIERLQFKAERYSAERQVRKNIEKEVLSLAELATQWEVWRKKIEEDQKFIAAEMEVIRIAESIARQKAAGEEKAALKVPTDPRDLEYYTVKKTASLREISALQEVYGNADAWKYIFDANRGKVLTPESIVPEGTTLVIPKIKNSTNFVDLN